MKRITRALCILISVAAVAFALIGCADPGAPIHKKADPSTYAVSVASVEQKLDDFMRGRSDRTSYTDAEKAAAEYLRDTLVGYGYADASVQGGGGAALPSSPSEDGEQPAGMIREFTVNDGDIVLQSRNVVAVYGDSGATNKNVIIGAYYDNFYSTPYPESKRKGNKSHGALGNGSGVAALMGIAEYLQTEKPSLDFTVTLAFFGASSVDNAGVKNFYDKMTAREKSGTVLMIELQRLGVDHVYAYSDSRETKREPFFDGIARRNGLDIYKVTQKSPVMTDVSGLNGIPYYQWAMYGNFGVFFNHNIPTLNLVGANWETMDLTDRESADNDDMEFTDSDTLSNLKKRYPDYGDKIASAATLVVKSLEDGDFLKTMTYDLEHFPDTDVLNKNWIWYLVVLGIALIAGGIMTFITSRLAKKYPPVAPQPRKMKMAVFGMDYEDKDSADIFVDIKTPEPFDDIFPGVPNNDSAQNADPFGMYAPPTGAPTEDTARSENGQGEQPRPEQEKQSQPEQTDEQQPNREQSESVRTVEAPPEEQRHGSDAEVEPEAGEAKSPSVDEASADGVKSTAAQKPRASKKTASATPRKRAPMAKKTVKTNGDEKSDDNDNGGGAGE